MKINPNEFARSASLSVKKELSEGIKSFVAVGCRHGTFKTGTRFLEVGHVCIETDKDPLKEVGCTHYIRFPLIESMLWALGNYAYAIGYRHEFDPESIEDFQKVMMSGPLKVKLVEDDYGLQAKKYFPCEIERDGDGFPIFPEEVGDLVIKAEQWIQKAFDKAREREGNTFKAPSRKDYDPNSTVPF